MLYWVIKTDFQTLNIDASFGILFRFSFDDGLVSIHQDLHKSTTFGKWTHINFDMLIARLNQAIELNSPPLIDRNFQKIFKKK